MMRKSDGFSLIETLAAVTVFGLITVGITPLIVSSMRGSSLARSYTVGKNLGQEAMERVRGLPYFDSAPARDALDLYYPNLVTGVGSGYNGTTQSFTTVCTATTAAPAASGARACPPDHPDGTSRIPAGYTVSYVARFVTPSTTAPGTLVTEPPPAGYDSAAPATATPPTLTEIVITVSWNRLGAARSFTLSSLLGQRKLSINRLSATAKIDFVVQALTSFQESSGRLSSIKATAGRSTSDIGVRGFAAADQDTRAGELVLTRNEFGTEAGTTLAELTGASSTLHAPPNTTPAPVATKGPQVVTHSEGFGSLDVARLGSSIVNEATDAPSTVTTGELPRTLANFALTTGSGSKSFWIRNQSNGTLLGLGGSSDTHPFYVKRDSGPVRLSGKTYAEGTSPTPTASRKVHATLSAVSSPLHLFPTSFADDGVVRIRNFAMTMECKSTGSLATSIVSAEWSAILDWWNNGSYTSVTIGGNHANAPGTVDPLATWHIGNNPKVGEICFLLSCTNRYLFDDPNALPTPKIGYLRSWQTTTVVPTSKTATRTEAELPFAIDIRTAPTDSSISETAISVSVGKASCFAEDLR
jgi:Tfp pilus assembly protein PilV